MDTDKQYLGDGVYIERSPDPYQIHLYTSNGIAPSNDSNDSNDIFLECDMIWGIINYATKHGIIKEPPK
jgi:hypothetical protein